MKYRLFFSVFIAIVLFACSAEKRQYRHGWYFDHSHKNTHATELTIAPSGSPAVSSASSTCPQSPVTTASVPHQMKTDSSFVQMGKHVLRHETKKDTSRYMSNKQARAGMKQKGCQPGKSVEFTYVMGIVSLVLTLILLIGFIPAVINLFLCRRAKRNVIAKGECVDENLAILKQARLFSLISVLYIAILALLFGFLLFLFAALGG